MLLHLPSPFVPHEDDHGAVVVVLVAVVGRGEHREQLAAREVLVAMLHALVSADDELEPVAAVEVLHSVRAEATRVLAPRRAVHAEHLVVVRGVGPQGVQDDAVLPRRRGVDLAHDLDRLRDAPQVVEGVDAIADAAVDAQDGAVHQGGDRQELEDVVHPLPDELTFRRELSSAALVEAVIDVHQAVFVVAAHQEDLPGVQELQGEEQQHHVARVRAPVHEVAQKNVRHRPDVAPALVGPRKGVEELEQVQQLPVDVAVHPARQGDLHQGVLPP
mmetsp:Transcript_104043/g.299107  ORF Transcript_104043/g.299107 Transcript_104043/m.299107 type:complete len:274 (-) Transcript_104043:326-1147(-)